MITVVLGFRVSKALAVASVCLRSCIVIGCLRELSQFVTTRSMAGAGRRRIQRACVSPPPRPAPGQGCRIGLAETVNGSEWTGSERHTDRRSELIYKIINLVIHNLLVGY
jgi:hypothetical protein